MVKDYYQLINDDLKYIYTGDDEGIRQKVDKELGGDVEEAQKLILEDIENGNKRIKELREKNETLDKESVEFYENSVKVANIELGIAKAKVELEKVKGIDKSKLKIYAFERVEL